MPVTSRLSCERFRLACLARDGVAEVTELVGICAAPSLLQSGASYSAFVR